jgi:microcystin-dependent protein
MAISRTASAEPGEVPTGTVLAMASPSVPVGFLECNGATVSRTTYSALFSLIGTTYGAGDSSTTFVLPDLRGAFIRGWDNGRTIDNARAFANTQTSAPSGHQHNPGAGAGAGGSTAITAVQGFPYNVAMYYIIKY